MVKNLSKLVLAISKSKNSIPYFLKDKFVVIIVGFQPYDIYKFIGKIRTKYN
jgi:hypothetical protein